MILGGYVSYYFRHMLLLYKFCVVNVFCQIYLRARWLKDLNPEAEQLFSMVAEVFIFWAKSHVRMIHSVFIYLFFSCQCRLSEYFVH